ncbi:hypothetical protein [Pseudomonas chlororaphis]|uniref:hypothetical protein n=1 Tax=Pseudomonas chlororaphis TaxID=587753 RepID=UPI0004720152|nr:hypothetical protein [Pseudomonas chlororaphis]
MTQHFIISAALLLFSCASYAGVFKDEVDRFNGSRSVSWMSIPEEAEGFSLSTMAFYPKGYAAPYAYRIELLTRADRWQYLDCHHSDWLVDGVRDPYLEMEYSNTVAGSSTMERFTKRVDRQNLERLASAKLVEFKVCGTEGKVSEKDMDGLRKVVNATR